MRYLLFCDVHANLPALNAVLADAETKGELAGIYHLGDLVGYAPWPNEVIGRLRDAGIPGVAGNYDSTVATHYKHCGCRSENAHQEELAHQSFAWTLEHTSEASRQFVRVEYDVEAAARGILESELPDEFAEFLRTGGTSTTPTESTSPTTNNQTE